MFRKGLAVAVILLSIGMSVVPSTAVKELKEKSSPISFDGNTLYVGGSGPNNYTTIQSAIDDAVDGDTVFVYDDSSPYYENVIINQSIDLIGEKRNTTNIISVGQNSHAIHILSDSVNIKGFSLTGSFDATAYSGIYIESDFNTIQECNMIDSVGSGITLYGRNNLVNNNIISENGGYGIYVIGPHQEMNNTISNNSIIFNEVDGIRFNEIHNDNKIYHNDFINNLRRNAYDANSNSWDNGYPSGGNYWNDYTGNDSNGDGIGDLPYYIEGGNNSDQYPLMNPLKEYNEPIAYFTYDIDDLIVTFNGSLSFDPDGTITTWLWDFGDGVEGAGNEVSHSYQTYGVYNVTLTVIDNSGKEDDIIKTITIEKPELYIKSFIFGRLDNRSINFEHITFEAVKIRVISFNPFSYTVLKSREEIKIIRFFYFGLLSEKYIFCIGMVFVNN